MIRGLYVSSLGMTTQMKRMDVASNNIANADTTGYKRDTVVTSSFPDLLTKRLHDGATAITTPFPKTVGNMSLGVTVDEVFTDFRQGGVYQTKDPYNVAIMGDGFFIVDVNGEERYTRDGSFILNGDGNLMTKDGALVRGVNGNVIQLTAGDTFINTEGDIFVEGVYRDSLMMTDFEDLTLLRKQEDNNYTAMPEAVQQPATGEVVQGYLENSNISLVREMVDLITVSRIYEANSKMIQAHDQSLGKAVNDIAAKR